MPDSLDNIIPNALGFKWKLFGWHLVNAKWCENTIIYGRKSYTIGKTNLSKI